MATAKVLVVAGGGGGGGQGGGNPGGGGGAGGLLYNATLTVFPIQYGVTVGTGGAGGLSQGTQGNGSIFDTLGTPITTTGGGSGGSNSNGGNGGSGGGGRANGGTGVAGQGFAGGKGGGNATGGGGGAGAIGNNNAAATTGGAGGVGVSNSITGSATFYAGGGGGSATVTAGAGGSGGGGNATVAGNGVAGTNGLGGGGGGGQGAGNSGGKGGDGIVIVAFTTTEFAGFYYSGTYTSGTNGTETWVRLLTSGTFALGPIFTLSDAVTVSEAVTMVLVHKPNVSDAVTVSDVPTIAPLKILPSVNDSVTVSEFVFLSVINFPSSPFDVVLVSEFIKLDIKDEVVVADTVTLSESVQFSIVDYIATSDTVTVTDTPTIAPLLLKVNVSDSVTASEFAFLSVVSSPSVIFDLVFVDETVTLHIPVETSVGDDIAVSEDVVVNIVNFVNVTDDITMNDVPSIDPLLLQVNVSDSVAVSEFLFLSTINFPTPVYDFVLVSEDVTLNIPVELIAHDDVGISESVDVRIPVEVTTFDVVTVADVPSIAPLLLQINVSDTVTVTDYEDIGSIPLLVSASDNILVSEFVTFDIRLPLETYDDVLVTEGFSGGASVTIFVSDDVTITENFNISKSGTTIAEYLPATLIMSGYKWLTQSLLSAQQKFLTRMSFTAQIIDDLILPNNVYAGTGTPAGNGSQASSPDGRMWTVGNDAGVLNVKWDTNLNANAGVWSNSITLNTAGDNFNDAQNVFSIAISDWYKGAYRISIWYFGNFGVGPDYTIIRQRSDDMGSTWVKTTFTPSSFPLGGTNLSLGAWKPVVSIDPVYGDEQMNEGCFYLKKNSNTLPGGFVGYDIYYIYGNAHGFASNNAWAQNANSFDWSIHDLSAYYLNGIQYVAFSGFRTVIDAISSSYPNFSVWTTGIITNTNDPSKSLWQTPIAAMPISSSTILNQNTFYNVGASVINGRVYLMFTAQVVDSVTQTSQGSTAQVVTTHTNTQYVQSDNGRNFSYPSVLLNPDGSEYVSGYQTSFEAQGGYIYAYSTFGTLLELIQNNIVADITGDVMGYQISSTAGQPESISININNSNNKWVGTSPTAPGASAVAKNRKIVIWQGYYNSSAIPEYVPRNVFYIDDINQTTSSTQNYLSLAGRDFYKKLKTTVTKYSYQYNGPTFFTDTFDGTYVSSWNQVVGTWTFNWQNVIPPMLAVTSTQVAGVEDLITLVSTNGQSYGSLTSVYFYHYPSSSGPHAHNYFYAIYIDSLNWLRLDIDNNGTMFNSPWSIVRSVNGAQSTLDSGVTPSAYSPGGNWYPIFIRRYDYTKFQFFTELYGDGTGNSLIDYDPTTADSYCFTSGGGSIDVSNTMVNNANWQKGFTVGFGCKDKPNNGTRVFRFFKHATYNNPNNLGYIIRTLARLAGVFSFKLRYTWREMLYASNFSGVFTIANRVMTLTAGNQAIQTNSAYQPFSNGEIAFKARLIFPSNPPSTSAGFSFIFRKGPGANGQDDYYKFHVMVKGNALFNPPVFTRFERRPQVEGRTFTFYNTANDMTTNPQTSGGNAYDLTKWHDFRIFMIDGWMYAFIDDVMVASWNDNNISYDYLTTGTWGFECDANTTLQVQNITAPDFWKPVQTFSLNPGDDAESAIDSLTTSLRAFNFSDMFGRFKTIFLGSGSPSTYTYNTQLISQNVDSSDKEYISQVTVFGNGVQATSRNTNLMPGVITREEVIVDYQIITQKDAQTRADNEMTNINQYRNQSMPKQIMNVGAELFDVVTVTNIGNNNSGVNSTTRVYGQTLTESTGGNQKSDYTVELSTGNV